MKRILIFGLSPILGGVETYIYNLIKNMDKEGFYYDFLIIGNEKSVFEDEINKILGDGENHFYYCPNLKKNFLKGSTWLKNFYDKNKYDVIYLNTCTAARIMYCIYTIKKYNTLLITHSHTANTTRKVHILNNKIFRNCITKKSSRKLACSELAYKWMFNGNIRYDYIVPNGIDLNRFKFNREDRTQIRSKLNFCDKDIVVGNIGRFTTQKNQKFLVKLSECLNDNYKFLLIGDGELKKEINKKIKEKNLNNKFVILPVQEDIEKYYSAMDIFAMPSIYEGLPITAVEAQATGLPCVFSNRISKEVNLSNRCEFIPIDNSKKWIDSIINCNIERYDGTRIIKEKGFDIGNTTRKVSKILKSL